MDTFFHINDYGTMGWIALETALAISRKVYLWAPSFTLLERAYLDGHSRITSDHLIKLIKIGKIEIMGREEWFSKSARINNTKWQHALWHDKYDQLLIELKLESEISFENKFIHVINKENGWDWAFSLNEESIPYQKAKEYYESGNLPLGVIEKAKRFKEKEDIDPIRVILRDAKNFQDAFESSSATIPFMLEKYPEYVVDILDIEINKEMKIIEIEKEKLKELIDFLISLNMQNPLDFDGFMKIITSRNYSDLIHSELDDYFESKLSIKKKIYKELSEKLKKRSEIADFGEKFSLGVDFLDILMLGIPSIPKTMLNALIYMRNKDNPRHFLPFLVLCNKIKPNRREIIYILQEIRQTLSS